MTEAAKKFIKDNGLLIKNVTFKKDEPITSGEVYDKYYKPCKGGIVDTGFAFFATFWGDPFKNTTGTLHTMSEEVEKEIFKTDIDYI